MNSRKDIEARIMINLGVIQQLMATRQLKLFKKLELTYSQFSLLNHFSHNPERSWTVTELARSMEMNQPGITKVVSTLLKKNLLSVKIDQYDARKRHISITHRGLKLCQKTMNQLSPDVAFILENWTDQDLKQMQHHLEKLMHVLDSHREDIK